VTLDPDAEVRGALAHLFKCFEQTGSAHAVVKQFDRELLRHWFRSRSRWLERNPMLAVRFISQRGCYYDTEFFVMGRIEAATSVLCMVACFQPHGTTKGLGGPRSSVHLL